MRDSASSPRLGTRQGMRVSLSHDALSVPALPPRAMATAAADPATTTTAATTATTAATASTTAATDAPGPEAAALGWLASAASYLPSFSAAPASAASAAASEGAEGPGVEHGPRGTAPSTPPRRASSRLPPIAGTPPSLAASPRTVNI